MNFNLHIERIILTDLNLDSQQKDEFKAAIELALQDQFKSHGAGSIMQSSTNLSSIKGDSISVNTACKAENFGQQIGNAIFRGIGQ